jgi:hypothetical protein
MKLFEFLCAQDPTITPKTSKIHLATCNGHDNPLDVYYRGAFDEWQRCQNQLNFRRDYVVALIQLPEADRWLFVGVYATRGVTERSPRSFYYDLESLPAYAKYAGRLYVTFVRSRASYLLAENCCERMEVLSITAEPVKLNDFPGFKTVNISFDDLEYLVRSGNTSWRTALGSVAGVYLISDTATARLYVGSATGEGGIWSRWSQYVDGHGKNVRLKELVGVEGVERAKVFRFSVLEIADTHASSEEVLRRESHWKQVLLTRVYGWNAN